jgi:hypothetical protein
MKFTFLKLTLFVVIVLTGVPSQADTITLWLPSVNATNAASQIYATYFVPSNTVAKIANVVGAIEHQTYLYFTNQDKTLLLTAPFTTPISIVGPASITLSSYGAFPAFSTIETTSSISAGPATTPSTAVVIPADSGGPVTIVLESSVDLVNWTPALPGTYGTSATNRFFRVRAQR